MRDKSDLIFAAIDQKRDIRFWFDAVRVTMSPYLIAPGAEGDAVVAGLSAVHRPMSIRMSEMVGIEIVPRRPRGAPAWDEATLAEVRALTRPA